MGIRSERRLCDEVHLNLAYRWFCGLGLDGRVPDHSTFSKNRHGRFRQSDMLRRLFETVVERCLAEGLVGADGFAVDASLIAADAHPVAALTAAPQFPMLGAVGSEGCAHLISGVFQPGKVAAHTAGSNEAGRAPWIHCSLERTVVRR